MSILNKNAPKKNENINTYIISTLFKKMTKERRSSIICFPDLIYFLKNCKNATKKNATTKGFKPLKIKFIIVVLPCECKNAKSIIINIDGKTIAREQMIPYQKPNAL
jgi:hypothetical protein